MATLTNTLFSEPKAYMNKKGLITWQCVVTIDGRMAATVYGISADDVRGRAWRVAEVLQ